MKKSALVTLADESYVEYAKQLFYSAYVYGGWEGEFLLLADNIPDNKLSWFRKNKIKIKHIHKIELDNGTKYMGTNGDLWPTTVLNKLFVFQKDIKKWEQVVFLDTDIIVNGDIRCLAKVKGLYAVKDFYSDMALRFRHVTYLTKEEKVLFKNIKKSGILKKEAFNSGVLAFSTDIINNNTFVDLMAITKKYGSIVIGDEAILNIYFTNKWKPLHEIYNFQIVSYKRTYKRSNNYCIPAIYHFVTRDNHEKPWHVNSNYYSIWRKNYQNAENNRLINFPQRTNYISEKSFRKGKFFYNINIFAFLRRKTDRYLGICGIYLRRHNFKIYLLLKNGVKW